LSRSQINSKLPHSLDAPIIETIPTGTLLNINLIHPNVTLILHLITPILSVKTKAKELQVSRLDSFNRLNVSNVEGIITFQHNIRISQER